MTFGEYIESNIKYDSVKYFKPCYFDKMAEMFDEMGEAASNTTDNIVCGVGDWDVDGVLALKILTNTFQDIGLTNYDTYFGTQKEHGMTQSFVNECIQKGYKYVVVVDSSSNSMDIIKYLTSIGIKVMIIDHHVCNYDYEDYPEGSVIINSKMEGNEVIKEISAGYLTYLVTSYYRDRIGQSIKESDMWFGYITLISDSCKLSDEYIKPIVLDIQKIRNVPREIELFTNKYSILNRRFFTYNFNNKINNMCRLERVDLLEELFYKERSDDRKEQIVMEINELHQVCKEGLKKLIEEIDTNVIDMGSCTFVDLNQALTTTSLPEVYLVNATGLVASFVSSKTHKASIAYISLDKDNYKLSGRDNYSDYPFQGMLKSLNLEGGGHLAAVGFKVPKIDFKRLKEYASNVQEVSTKESEHLIMTVKDFSPFNLKKLFRNVATLNEIAGSGVKPIRLRVELQPKNLVKKDFGRLRVFESGGVSIKDLMQTKEYGDTVDVEPEYNKFEEALVCYF